MSDMTESLLFIRALQAHLDRFEDLLGDDWPAFQQRLQVLVDALAQANSDDPIPTLVDDIIELGSDYPAVSDLTRALLRSARDGAGSTDATTRSVRVTDPTSGEIRVVDARPEGSLTEPIVPVDEVISQDVIAAGLELSNSLRASYVNFTFIDVSLGGLEQELKPHEGLLASHEYRLEVGLGLDPDQRFGNEQQPPMPSPDVSIETIDLYVTIFARNRTIRILGDPLAVLKWPARGPSRENGVFVLHAAEVGEGEIDVYIYHKTNLLYTASFRAVVQPDGYEWNETARPITWRYQPDEDKNRSLLFRNFVRANQLSATRNVIWFSSQGLNRRCCAGVSQNSPQTPLPTRPAR